MLTCLLYQARFLGVIRESAYFVQRGAGGAGRRVGVEGGILSLVKWVYGVENGH